MTLDRRRFLQLAAAMAALGTLTERALEPEQEEEEEEVELHFTSGAASGGFWVP